MKKFFGYIIISILIVTLAFSLFKISNKYRVGILKDGIECTIIAKGCDEAKAITTNAEGDIYIAYRDSIRTINYEGKESMLYKNSDLDIEDIVFANSNIYMVSKNFLLKYSVCNNTIEKIVDNIPSGGNNIKRNLVSNENELLLTIPSISNSGIAEGNEYDKYPINVELSGQNYGEMLTGAFKAYGEKSFEGEKIKKAKIGNAAVYKIDLKNNSINLFASGIRGITGIDYDSNNNIKAIFSGMKNEGVRPVNRDKDYIYELQENTWYGWPDYSGGDPISSPRFKGDNIINAVIKNPPTRIVPAPIYQWDEVDSLKELSIDISGNVLPKDTMLFYDGKCKLVVALTNEGACYKVLKTSENSNVVDSVYNGDEFLLLDTGIGCIYSVHEEAGIMGFKLPMAIWAFILVLTFTSFVIVTMKLMKNRNNIVK